MFDEYCCFFYQIEQTKSDADKDKQAYAVIYHVTQFKQPSQGEMWFEGKRYQWQLMKKTANWQVVVEDDQWRWRATAKKIVRERIYLD